MKKLLTILVVLAVVALLLDALGLVRLPNLGPRTFTLEDRGASPPGGGTLEQYGSAPLAPVGMSENDVAGNRQSRTDRHRPALDGLLFSVENEK
ncbi:hypothetical protein KKB83_01200 [Patescibacteria group bacterium]|nr:hypothetical protein [Patescibacteria group bacterium]